MSYSIYLVDKNTRETLTADFSSTSREGTYCLSDSPTRRCEFNITYNYRPFFVKTIDKDEGIRKLYGMTAKESIPVLEKAISMLGDDVDADYWKATEGNAKEALKGLLTIAKAADPDGVWSGD